MALGSPLHQAAGDALRDVRPRARSGADTGTLSRGEVRRCDRVLLRRAVVLHRPLAGRSCTQSDAGPSTGARLRGRVREGERPAAAAGEAVGELPREPAAVADSLYCPALRTGSTAAEIASVA